MSLLKFSTTVPVHRTLGQVTELLVKAGARQMMTDYAEDGAPSEIAFSVETAMGVRAFTLR